MCVCVCVCVCAANELGNNYDEQRLSTLAEKRAVRKEAGMVLLLQQLPL